MVGHMLEVSVYPFVRTVTVTTTEWEARVADHCKDYGGVEEYDFTVTNNPTWLSRTGVTSVDCNNGAHFFGRDLFDD
jgi:hypothetical protein